MEPRNVKLVTVLTICVLTFLCQFQGSQGLRVPRDADPEEAVVYYDEEGEEIDQGAPNEPGEGDEEEDELDQYGERGIKMARVNKFAKNKQKCDKVSQIPVLNDCNRFIHCPA